MVALYQDPNLERSDTEKRKLMSSKGVAPDRTNSPMQSDGGGRSSTTSSPPSAGEMSYVVEDEQESSRKEALTPHKSLDSLQSIASNETSEGEEKNVRSSADTHASSSQNEPTKDYSPDTSSSMQPLILPSRAGKIDPNISSYRSLEGSFRRNIPIAPANASAVEVEQVQGSTVASLPFSEDSDVPRSAPTVAIPTRGAVAKGSPRLGSTKSKPAVALRRGKWTVEEEAYVARVIQDFNSGFLNAPAGTTLRTYLSEKLKCDPMRITKKFTGDACIGKRVFHPAVRTPGNAAAIDKAQAELDSLERRWRRRLEMQQRETAKKAAASAAVAAVASGRGLSSSSNEMASDDIGRNPVAKTASWLDRAKSALKDAPNEVATQEALQLQDQMHEVQRLIHEGPNIQQTSADLPQMLDDEGSAEGDKPSSQAEPADKRMKTAEDAEALVGFLRSVRSAAASGEEF